MPGIAKGHPGMTILAVILGEMFLRSQGRSVGKYMEMGQQEEFIEGQTAAASPEDAYYQAMGPTTSADRDMAQQALMAKLMGVGGPSLVKGEERIGR